MAPNLAALGIFLPELLAMIAALLMLNNAAARGQARNYGLAGIGIMLTCSVLGMGLSFLQNAMIANASGSATGFSTMFSLMYAVRVLLNLCSLSGLLLLVWGLCKASRAAADPGAEVPANDGHGTGEA